MFREIIVIYCDNHTNRYTNKLCGQSRKLFNLKEDGTYAYSCNLQADQ
jgi:hypothetical protein